MIEMRRGQLSFGDGFVALGGRDFGEGGMKHADVVLSDEDIVAAVYEALARRHPKSRSRGRRGAPAEMVLRLLILKHSRNWIMPCSSARCAPIWCTATSPASAPAERLMQRRWDVGAWRWGRRWSSRFTKGS